MDTARPATPCDDADITLLPLHLRVALWSLGAALGAGLDLSLLRVLQG